MNFTHQSMGTGMLRLAMKNCCQVRARSGSGDLKYIPEVTSDEGSGKWEVETGSLAFCSRDSWLLHRETTSNCRQQVTAFNISFVQGTLRRMNVSIIL